MSYIRNLDEYNENELFAEAARRRELRESGLCDYCGRPSDTPACKFSARHRVPGQMIEEEKRRQQEFEEATTRDVRRMMQQ